MSTIRTILFDLDGTLLDTHDMILVSMRYAINEVEGKNHTDEELMAGVGTPLYDQMLGFANGDVARAEELVTIYRAYNDAIHDERVSAFPGTREALEKLAHAGYRMGIVTSKRHWLAERGLEKSGIASFFDILIGADDWPDSKPKPGPILYACELLDCTPEECVYIGDSPFDMQAANAAGCTSVAALWGMFPAETLAACKPNLSYSSLEEFVRELVLGGITAQ
ncbi:MAG: HAD-IA family hydrolase [Coriobacteriales bacterium]